MRRLGFDYYAYGVRHTIPFTRPKTEVHGTCPKAWLERYQMQNYGAVDPAILNGLRSSEMVVWSDSLFDQSRMFWNEARDWGLPGVGATCRSARRTVCSACFPWRATSRVSPASSAGNPPAAAFT